MTAPRIFLSLLTAYLLGLSLPAMAQYDYPTDPVISGKGAGERVQIYSGTVTKLDAKNRVVTLKSKDGQIDIFAGPEVKNFVQIKLGDRLDIAYKLAIVMELEKIKNNPTDHKVNLAKQNIVKTSASVVAIDKKSQILTLKESQGNVLNLKIENPTLLKGLSVKDLVNVTYAPPIAFEMNFIKK